MQPLRQFRVVLHSVARRNTPGLRASTTGLVASGLAAAWRVGDRGGCGPDLPQASTRTAVMRDAEKD